MVPVTKMGTCAVCTSPIMRPMMENVVANLVVHKIGLGLLLRSRNFKHHGTICCVRSLMQLETLRARVHNAIAVVVAAVPFCRIVVSKAAVEHFRHGHWSVEAVLQVL